MISEEYFIFNNETLNVFFIKMIEMIDDIKEKGNLLCYIRQEIYLIEPTLPQDFKGFIQRLMMLINEMDTTEVTYKPERNSIIFWYD